MTEFLMKPKVDFAFKEVMENEKARIGFLSAMLKIQPEDIRETRILNTSLRKGHKDDKQGILDVRILMNDDTEADIEIQLTELKVWAERSLFYLSKMYTEQIASGQDYDVFKKCVSISVLDFDLFRGETEFYSCFHIREDTRSFIYTDKVEFHVIELPKLPKELREDCSSLVHRIISNQPCDLPDFPSAALSSIDVATATPHSSALHMENHSASYSQKLIFRCTGALGKVYQCRAEGGV